MKFLLPPPPGDNGVELADWLEASLLVENQHRVSRSKIRKALQDALHSAEDELEAAVEFLLREVMRRQSIAPLLYPFSSAAEGGVQCQDHVDRCVYSFLLCMSVSIPFRQQQRWRDTDRWFDRLVIEALKSSLGPGSTGVRFGTPASDGRPAGFEEAIHWLCELLRLPHGPAPLIGRPNDDGVDVVVWRPFADGRTSFLVVLGQCTVQKDPATWVDKARECDPRTWLGWIDFAHYPATCLAVPFVISETTDRWDQIRRATALLLDRMRLCELLQGIALPDEQEICAWVEAELTVMADGE